jgi:S1-C subfamily serine protease
MIHHRILLILLKCAILNFAYAINGKYVAQGSMYVKNQSMENAKYDDHKYIIEIAISEFSGQGTVTIVDEAFPNLASVYKITAKADDPINTGGPNEITWLYLGSLSLYNFTEPANVFITTNLNGEVQRITGFAHNMSWERHWANLVPYEETLSSTGSGFLISSDGYLLTNYHVVKKAKGISILFNGSSVKYPATLIKYDSENDLALLKIKNSNFIINYKMLDSEIDVGSSVFALGYPMISVMGSEIKLTDGIISSRSGYMNDKTIYQISSPIQPGNSGGPLFDIHGNLIGMTSSGITSLNNVGYAIKSTVISRFLSSCGVSKPNGTSASQQNSLPSKVKLLTQNIVSIIAIR